MTKLCQCCSKRYLCKEVDTKEEELRIDGKHYKCKLGKNKYSFRNIHKWED